MADHFLPSDVVEPLCLADEVFDLPHFSIDDMGGGDIDTFIQDITDIHDEGDPQYY
jgi:hypothetical protein